MTVNMRQIRTSLTDPNWSTKLKNLNKKEAQDIMDIAGNVTPIAALTREDELELIARSQDGDSTATEALVRSQVRALVKLVTSINPNESLRSDLFQTGVVAFIEEIGNYDPAVHYSRLWQRSLPSVRGAMMDEILSMDYAVLIPHDESSSTDATRMSRSDAMGDTTSWDEPTNDEGLTLADVTPDLHGGAIGALYEDRQAVEELLSHITNPDHVYIIKASFGFFGEMTDDEIAEEVGVKRTGVVMARQRAMAKLRKLVEQQDEEEPFVEMSDRDFIASTIWSLRRVGWYISVVVPRQDNGRTFVLRHADGRRWLLRAPARAAA